ncbi:MAG: hypothetical protein JSW07_04000 [bacterium]|nr:MAG: hypothetical protein JSW07_04000 [bacterium]
MKAKSCIFSLMVLGLIFNLLLSCGKSPSNVPLPLTGAIKISAHIDIVEVDSMFVTLDNVDKGLHPNGSVLKDIEAGKHQVVVSKKDAESPIDFTSTPRFVAVNANETTNVDFALTKLAPNFTLKNLNNEDITLGNYRHRVVLLVFYFHT